MRYLALAADYDGTLAMSGSLSAEVEGALEQLRSSEQCLKSVDRLGRGRTFPGDRLKVPSKTGVATLVGKVRPDVHCSF